MTRRQIVLALVPVLLGVGLLAWQRWTAPGPVRVEAAERAVPLRVLTLEPVTVAPRAVGYGVTQPGRTWRAVARVEGRVVQVREGLRAGERVPQGTLLVTLDPTPYELELARLQADIARTEAELEELATRATNDRAALAIERASLELAREELQRLNELLASGTVSQSQVDATRRNVLVQEQNVQRLESSLALVPSQQRAKEAALAARRAQLGQAELDRGYTRIHAPLDCVLGPVELEEGQFVARGERLFEAFGIDRVDLDAQFLYGDARRLIGPAAAGRLAVAATTGRLPDEELSEIFRARVRLRSGDLVAEWEGRVTGMREVIDSSSRAVALRVSVDEPYAQAIPGVRPPLLIGSFCEVELRGLSQAGRLLVPRSALRGGEVWVVDAEDRLRTRPVVPAFEQGEAVVLAEGLSAGERVLVSDPGAALVGTLVDPVEDRELAAALRAEVEAPGE